MKSKDNKFFIELYPDSESYNYEEILNKIMALALKYAYCLHDKDVTEDGEIKKAHIHVYCKTENQMSAKSFAEHVGLPLNFSFYANNEKGCIRYLIHFDNPEKYQYQFENIVSNFDLTSYFIDKETEKMLMISEVYKIIKENKLHSFNDLMDIAFQMNNPKVINCIVQRAYFWKQILSEGVK